MSFPELEVLTNSVSRIFQIEDVTSGNGKEMIARYRGRFIGDDTAAAYDQLAEAVNQYGITPLFRKDGDRQTIILVPTPVIPGRSPRVWVNVVLFILTVLSVMLTGADIPISAMPADGSIPWMYMFQHI